MSEGATLPPLVPWITTISLLWLLSVIFHIKLSDTVTDSSISVITSNVLSSFRHITFNCTAPEYRYSYAVSSPYGVSPAPYSGVFIPLYVSHNLQTVQPKIRSAVISVHGYSRGADEYFCSTMKATYPRDDTLIISPLFAQSQLTSEEWGNNTDPDTVSVYWSTSNWMKGANNSPHPAKYISSFDILDSLVSLLLNTTQFPSLSSVAVSGFSAGAQMVQRYAWASSIGLTDNSFGRVRFIVSDPSSYLYLSEHRPDVTCRPFINMGVDTDAVCSNYRAPALNETQECPGYNSWKYGTSIFPSSGYAYLAPFVNNRTAVAVNTENFLRKDVRYLLGDKDMCNCNALGYKNDAECFPVYGSECTPSMNGNMCCDTHPDSRNNLLSNSCESGLQGNNRLQRGMLYMEYLNSIMNTSTGHFVSYSIIKGMAHNRTAFFESEEFQNWAFSSS